MTFPGGRPGQVGIKAIVDEIGSHSSPRPSSLEHQGTRHPLKVSRTGQLRLNYFSSQGIVNIQKPGTWAAVCELTKRYVLGTIELPMVCEPLLGASGWLFRASPNLRRKSINWACDFTSYVSAPVPIAAALEGMTRGREKSAPRPS